MASIIRVKRSTGTIAPATLNYGELGLTIGVGTHGNSGGRLFVGDNSSNPLVVGGRYYTDLLSIGPGLVAGQSNPTTPLNGFVAILNSDRKVDQWNVDNITIDLNTISSTNVDGDINLDPNGTGEIVIPDDTYLTFGTSKDVKLRYDELTDDRFEIEGADWNFANNVAISISDTTASTTPTTGALTVTGGVGFATHLNVGGSVDIDLDLNVDGGDITTNLTAFNLLNATATNINAFGAATALVVGATSGIATINNPTVVGTQATQNLYNTVATTVNAFGAGTAVNLGANSGTLTVGNPTVVGTQATQNLYNTVATNLNFSGAATALVIGATSGIATINNPTVVGTQATQNLYNTVATTVNAFGDASTIGIGSTSATLTLRPNTVVGVNATQNLYNTTATTVNAFGAGTAVNLGANSGTLTVGNPTVVGTQATQNLYNTVATNLNFAGDATALVIGATSGVTTIRNATVDLDGDLNVDGGDITTNLTAFNLLNATATNINAFGAATALVVGATSGIATINNPTVVGTQATQNLYNTVATTVNAFGAGTAVNLGANSGTLTVGNPTVVGTQATQNLYNTVATNLNFSGAATALVIGATSGIATINNPTVVGTQATQNLYNTVATNLNFAGAATALVIGASTGIATISNATLSVPNATTLNLGATSSATSVNFQSTPNTSFVSIAATTNATTTTSGALRVAGGVGIVSDVYIGGILNVTGSHTGTNLTLTGNLQVDGNTTLGNAPGDVVTITGSVNHTGPLTNTGGVTIDNIGISSNVISTRSGGGNILYIDPYPDGLSNEGMVVIKGDLQVDGTTTTVNSSSVTVNDAILSLGEVTSARTVVATVASGVSTISLDSVVGINTGDIITGNAALPNSGLTTITAYNTATKIITITGTTSSGISTTSQLTVIHAYDTNTDRGISFDYNTGVGTANNKIGFFGYHDTTNSGSAAPVRSWTYVPDATNSNNVITGTRGYLDIKGIYYQTGDFNTHGVVFFDNDGLQTSTNNPSTASSTRTSTQILTAVTEINLSLPSSTSVTAGDQVTQVNNGGAYGVVKTTVSGTTITLIGVQGTFDITNDLKVNGANISIIPGTVTTIYTNKPMWTDTLDGGTF